MLLPPREEAKTNKKPKSPSQNEAKTPETLPPLPRQKKKKSPKKGTPLFIILLELHNEFMTGKHNFLPGLDAEYNFS